MSRWSKRSEAEQQRILEEQQLLQNTKKPSGSKLRADFMNMDRAKEIYDEGRIPIFCRTDGWYAGDFYVVYRGKSPLASGEVDFIKATCNECGRTSKRAVPYGDMGEMMMFALALAGLKREGMVKDERPQTGRKP